MKNNSDHIIAKFMNIPFEDKLYKKSEFFPIIKKDTSVLEFSSSWDWIMLVVKEILSNDEPEKGSIGWYIYNRMDSLLHTTDLTLVYNNIVEYVIWYEKQNIKTTPEFKGTKGKWHQGTEFCENTNSDIIQIYATNEEMELICKVYKDGALLTDQNFKANATLITNAPELLEILNNITNGNDVYHNIKNGKLLINKILSVK